jgi:tetratricopeptide (TPR) repeat protein
VRIVKLIITFCIFFNCLAFGQKRIVQQTDNENGKDPGYLFAFTEATKLYLFGDYGRAVGLFNECLKYEPKSAAVHYQLAQIYIKAGDINSARKYSQQAFKLEPDNIWYALQVASIYQAANMPDSAIGVFLGLLKKSPRDINLMYRLASLYEQEGKEKDALQYLDNIEKQTGLSREVCISKSRIYGKMGKDKKAVQELRVCLSGGEEDYIILGIMAEFYRTRHQTDSAQYYYDLIEKKHRDDANVMFSYGEFLLEQKQWAKARGVYLDLFSNSKIDSSTLFNYLYSAIQDERQFGLLRPVLDTVVEGMYMRSKSNIRVLSLYSDVKYRLGDFKDAAVILKKIIVMDDRNYSAWEQLLFSENALEQKDSVVEYGERAVEMFPERPLPYLVLGSVYYGNKNYEKAITLLKAGESNAGNDRLKIEFYSLLAECYGKTEEYELSDEYYKRALQIDSLNIPILNNFAYSLAVRGANINEAIAMSKYTIEKDPRNSTYLDTYAWVMFKNLNLDEADKYIRKAIEFGGGNNPEILSHYGDILAKKGKLKDAVVAWNEALKYGDIDLNNELKIKIAQVEKK